mmetsp:Transcript_20413/g.57451  ORF Transcript_20413/g.57451 Transcript_20413/m.57451 type:complete len:128 (+) Transcript_20413:148-531(+)
MRSAPLNNSTPQTLLWRVKGSCVDVEHNNYSFFSLKPEDNASPHRCTIANSTHDPHPRWTKGHGNGKAGLNVDVHAINNLLGLMMVHTSTTREGPHNPIPYFKTNPTKCTCSYPFLETRAQGRQRAS